MAFCPECEGEFVAGISVCPECQVDLVAELAQPIGEPDVRLEEAWVTYGETDAQLIQSLLASCEIESLLQGEAVRYIHGFNLNNLGKVRILVRPDDLEEARRVIEEAEEGRDQTEGFGQDQQD